MKRQTITWISAALIITLVFVTMYASVQQLTRQTANDPQIQLATDAASKLSHGETPNGLIRESLDIRTSLAPFINIYDQNGNPIIGSGLLAGQLPHIPLGVLKAAQSQEYYAVTWQPVHNVRLASVTVATDKYYVVSGRSLKEAEKRENGLLALSLSGWVLSLLVLLGCFVVQQKMSHGATLWHQLKKRLKILPFLN